MQEDNYSSGIMEYILLPFERSPMMIEVPSSREEQITEPHPPIDIIQGMLAGLELEGTELAIVPVQEEKSTTMEADEVQLD